MWLSLAFCRASLGFHYAMKGGLSVGLSDAIVPETKAKHIKSAQRDKHIERSGSVDLQAKGHTMPAMVVRNIPPKCSSILLHSQYKPSGREVKGSSAIPLQKRFCYIYFKTMVLP